MKTNRMTLYAVVAFAAAVLAACGDSKPPQPPEEARQHEAAVHEHHAPHGGSLVEIGEEFAHLELVLDPVHGKLTAFVLDGEAEKPLRLKERRLNFKLSLPSGSVVRMTLGALGSSLTGETPGDSSQFAGQADQLKGSAAFSGTVDSLDVKGVRFDNIGFSYPSSHGHAR